MVFGSWLYQSQLIGQYFSVLFHVTDTMGEERTQCRLPGRLNELLEEAAEESDSFRSEVTRRALRYYIGANPDGIEAFSGVSAPGIRGIDRRNTVDSKRMAESTTEMVSVTNTAEEGADEEVSDSEAADSDSESEDQAEADDTVSGPMSEPVYDPTEDL